MCATEARAVTLVGLGRGRACYCNGCENTFVAIIRHRFPTDVQMGGCSALVRSGKQKLRGSGEEAEVEAEVDPCSKTATRIGDYDDNTLLRGLSVSLGPFGSWFGTEQKQKQRQSGGRFLFKIGDENTWLQGLSVIPWLCSGVLVGGL